MLRFLTAGESHGPGLIGIIEGMPAGLEISIEEIDRDLARRQTGSGAGARMKIEQDRAELLGGLVDGATIGAPIAVQIRNRDHANWIDRPTPVQTIPRPGHADLAGAIKYGFDNMRLVAERASARETAMRVAIGCIARQFLSQFGILIGSYVLEIGGERADLPDLPYEERFRRARQSDVGVYDQVSGDRIRARIQEVIRSRDTAGGILEVVALHVPVGLGSHVHWDRKLDGRLAGAIMSIPSVKGVEIGDAFENSRKRGTEVQDAIEPSERLGDSGHAVRRTSNRAGGLEGGITNGEPLVIRAALKPIATTLTPLGSVDLASGLAAASEYQRSDFCHVPRAGVIGESMVAWVLAEALIEKLGGDSMTEMQAHYRSWRNPQAEVDRNEP